VRRRSCPCTRCRGFQPGNALAVTHGACSELRGARAVLKLGPRAAEIAVLLADAVPAYVDTYGPAQP
jgi:hypothetical protein